MSTKFRRIDERHVVIEIEQKTAFGIFALSDREWENTQREVLELAKRVFGGQHQVYTRNEATLICKACSEGPWEDLITDEGEPLCCYEARAQWWCETLELAPREAVVAP